MKVLIIGESCEDVFIYGKVNRLSPEAPVPVFIPTKVVKNGGMAANVLSNVKSLSKQSDIIHIIRQHSVITKTRYVDDKSNHMFMRVDEGDDKVQTISKSLINHIEFDTYDILIVSDYNKGFLTDDDVLEYVSKFKGISIFDSKSRLSKEILDAFTYVKVNEHEYQINKEIIDNHKWNVLITLGKDGVKYNDCLYPSPDPRDTIDVSGAGDTFVASFAVKYYETKDTDLSIKFANEMSSIVVSKRGVVTPL
jgi:D-beta-D-heptose 7-phosphate kinase/D-beta-D-heptose 1-phosphate adenosyltransferase